MGGESVKTRFRSATKLLRRHSTSANTRPSVPADEASLAHHQQSPSKQSCKYPSRPSSRLQVSIDEAVEDNDGHQAYASTVNSQETRDQLRPALKVVAPTPPQSQGTTNTVKFNDVQHDPPTPASSSHLVNEVTYPDCPSSSRGQQPIATPLSFTTVQERSELSDDYFGTAVQEPPVNMVRRKVWIKRPGASATLVQVAHDDMVDDVRDMVLRKYANSLGRTFDAPDVTIRISPRERTQQIAERMLSPEESICRILDAYFPGGQSVDEALLIDVPPKRTPRLSPRPMNNMTHYFDDQRPVENEGDYFPQMPAVSPGNQHTAPSIDGRPNLNHAFHPHSISVLETGQLPPLPSPRERKAHHRPKYGRQHTSSPTILGSVTASKANSTIPHLPGRRPLIDSTLNHPNHIPSPPPPPTPPAVEGPSKTISVRAPTPPLDRVSSPRPVKKFRQRKPSAADLQRPSPETRKMSDKQPTYAFLEGIVPPINVLIVEDNPINLRLLEMFAKRLKVRWQTAMNGRDAVVKWRTGGFHLVLMDIQLPIMSGIEATKEIRRLERVNGIGVFAKSEGEDRPGTGHEEGLDGHDAAAGVESAKDDDKLSLDGIFKSPVIIVALTASSLQSDRHEALAAGCNDFLTKPVSFVWLERKVTEWGCMQALIDFDGWRKWKDLAAEEEERKSKEADADPAAKAKREKRDAKRVAMLAKMGAVGGGGGWLMWSVGSGRGWRWRVEGCRIATGSGEVRLFLFVHTNTTFYATTRSVFVPCRTSKNDPVSLPGHLIDDAMRCMREMPNCPSGWPKERERTKKAPSVPPHSPLFPNSQRKETSRDPMPRKIKRSRQT